MLTVVGYYSNQPLIVLARLNCGTCHVQARNLHPGVSIRLNRLAFLTFQGYNIISVLSLEIIPIMELLASMKTHSVAEDIDVSNRHYTSEPSDSIQDICGSAKIIIQCDSIMMLFSNALMMH